MTCELNSGPCDDCEEPHCPEELDKIIRGRAYLFQAVIDKRVELDHAKSTLAIYEKIHKEALFGGGQND